ncbi:uncharacterized protein FRV6_10995 [Fusarium oxysporum]|uniref:Uncharacterized protein n=1 Tax=Fusarium oxysporum TaxID=5507 RepID=A0A2H3TDU1_FUSOX|nr:uncharacterized protein FRV6_10995 [Fusarium oxysporum]
MAEDIEHFELDFMVAAKSEAAADAGSR